MATYDDALTLRDARALYFEHNGFGANGGYDANWVKLELGWFPVFIPNLPARVRAVRIHDLHHVVTGYDTDLMGELRIAAWEIGGGCGGFVAAWVLNLWGLFLGLFRDVGAMRDAFIRGRRGENLYHEPFDDALLASTVGATRARLAVPTDVAPTPAERRDFVGWMTLAGVFSVLTWFGPYVLVGWGIVRLIG
jgi:hypothetical protein